MIELYNAILAVLGSTFYIHIPESIELGYISYAKNNFQKPTLC